MFVTGVEIDTTKEPTIFEPLWTITEHWKDLGVITWDKTKHGDTLFLHPLQIDGSMRGNNLFEFFKSKRFPVLNACVWEYLKEHNEEIPESWKFSTDGGEQYIFFWGTIDRSNSGDLYIRYLSWSGGNWVFSNYLMSGNWHEDFPAALNEKVTYDKM